MKQLTFKEWAKIHYPTVELCLKCNGAGCDDCEEDLAEWESDEARRILDEFLEIEAHDRQILHTSQAHSKTSSQTQDNAH